MEQEIHPAEAGYTLDEALEAYRPRLVICACMPPRIDWSASLRRAATVLEYLLVGPVDSSRSGDLCATWGGPEPFKTRGRSPQQPPFMAQGFVRHDLLHLSNLCLGTDDTPGRVAVPGGGPRLSLWGIRRGCLRPQTHGCSVDSTYTDASCERLSPQLLCLYGVRRYFPANESFAPIDGRTVDSTKNGHVF